MIKFEFYNVWKNMPKLFHRDFCIIDFGWSNTHDYDVIYPKEKWGDAKLDIFGCNVSRICIGLFNFYMYIVIKWRK